MMSPEAMQSHVVAHRMWKGVFMILFGVLFFLGTTGYWPEFTFAKYWPLVLIVYGLLQLCNCGSSCCMESKMLKK